MLRAIADGIVAVLLAPSCAACRRPLDAPTRGAVCGACWSAIRRFTPPLCTRCGETLASWRGIALDRGLCPRCRRVSSALSQMRAIGPHEGSLRAVLHALKYDGRRSLAPPLARLMLESCGAALEDIDVCVPVPLHHWRLWRRGFNQAEDLARRLERPVRRLLVRTRATRPQMDLPAARRHANVRGAFRVTDFARVGGLRIALIDDVCTTGATLEACARVLREAGAGDVVAVTAARALSRTRG